MKPFKDAIIKALKSEVKADASMLEVPQDPKHGDFTLPCFTYSKQFRQSPQEIARSLAKKIKPKSPIEKVMNIGAYLNFYISTSSLAKYALERIYAKKSNYGKSHAKKRIMVEYSSPNTNKPLHLGHIRNIVIGKALSKILKFAGNSVVQSCLVNDRGVHITKSMLAYQKWGGQAPDKKSDHFVGEFYVMYNEKSKIMPKLEAEAQELLNKWEAKDKEVLALWKKMTKWAEDGFAETYRRLGIKFNHTYYESRLYDKGRDIVKKGLKAHVFEKKDGAIYAPLKQFKMPDKVLVRADGTTLYMTQDIYLAIKKIKDYSLDTSVYVVGSEQNNHFRQLFKILELLGKKSKICFHMSYGMVYLPEGRMKSREGTVVDADEIIEEMIELARIEITKRHDDLSKKEVERRAKTIGIGALKFFMLRTDAARDMTYNPKESIAFEGETGPYIQYAYARIASILRKSDVRLKKTVDFKALGKEEKPLITHLLKFPSIASEATNYRPSMICRYLLDLAQLFNEYYHRIPILKAKPKEKAARLLLVFCVQEVLKTGLGLLDIDVLEEM